MKLRGLTLAIDPGKDTGWSLWTDASLIGAGLVDGDRPHIPTPPDGVDNLLVEIPQERVAGGGRRAPANDLIRLAFRAGTVVGGVHHVHRHEVLPVTWKGTLPKDVCARRVIERLSDFERVRLDASLSLISPGARHNALDAVGLGLYAVGRW